MSLNNDLLFVIWHHYLVFYSAIKCIISASFGNSVDYSLQRQFLNSYSTISAQHLTADTETIVQHLLTTEKYISSVECN